MSENELAKIVVQKVYEIHKTLGPGLLESVYQRILAYELRLEKLNLKTEVVIPLEWKGNKMDEGFRADIIVEDKLLIELKSVSEMKDVFLKQTLTYLKLTKIKLGLLVNFGSTDVSSGVRRVVNGLEE